MPVPDFGPKMKLKDWPAEDRKALADAAYAAWNDCAYDVLQAVAEEKGKHIDAVTVSRDVAMEVGLDADRWQTHIRDKEQKARIRNFMDRTSYTDLLTIAKDRFTFSRFGT